MDLKQLTDSNNILWESAFPVVRESHCDIKYMIEPESKAFLRVLQSSPDGGGGFEVKINSKDGDADITIISRTDSPTKLVHRRILSGVYKAADTIGLVVQHRNKRVVFALSVGNIMHDRFVWEYPESDIEPNIGNYFICDTDKSLGWTCEDFHEE